MPQTVQVDAGPFGGEALPIDELPSGEIAQLAEGGPADWAAGFRPPAGTPVQRFGDDIYFLALDRISSDMETKVCRLRPGQRVVIEPRVDAARSPSDSLSGL